MRRHGLWIGVLLCGLGLLAAAQEKGSWQPESRTAKGVTGPVSFGGEKLAISFTGYTLAQIRELEPAEIDALFHAEGRAGGSGNLFRTSIPGTKRFLNKNTLCGSEDTQWVATYVRGKELDLALFSGAKMPVFTSEAMETSINLCGTFSYVR